MDLLNEGLKKLGISITAEQRKKLDIFKSEIALFNPVYKLVSYEEESDLIIRHFLDCLAGVPVIKKELGDGVLADLGSGAGFPGIILAIMLEDNEIVLVERMKRRVDFLRNVILRCKLSNVKIINRDVKEVDDKFDVVTCRAFHPIYDIIKDVERIMKEGGAFMAYKGQRNYVEAELSDLCGYDYSFDDVKVPFLDEPRMICTIKRK
ncbi:MAG: 16S rRNA (guanine(527)-N(7))-methyltransferase RsmG [Sphaerochaetaceae bacterium]|nr:16S rRNA (guanine(527)-N(7))-methyltransferase RsmG [Sphaerochaetaceae bacterium]